MKIIRALISVSDKTGVAEFARALEKQGVDIISTGGTSELLRKAGVPVRDISSFTDYPEVLEGRVKTLHPRVHGGLLYKRGNALHERQAQEQGFQPIDLVVVNLYPFEATIARPGRKLSRPTSRRRLAGSSFATGRSMKRWPKRSAKSSAKSSSRRSSTGKRAPCSRRRKICA